VRQNVAGGSAPGADIAARSAAEASVPLATLKRRGEFLRVRGGARWSTAAFALEARPAAPAADAASQPARFGLTITKEAGTAVVRNRMRRRLKAAVAAVGPVHARPGMDYVLFARKPALDRPFEELKRDLEQALANVHGPAGKRRKR
jgi:ribonuclease P protein component